MGAPPVTDALQIFRRVDGTGTGRFINLDDMEVQSGFEPAELFEPFRGFQSPLGKGGAAFQGPRCKAVHTDVDVMWTAVGNGFSGEVERAAFGVAGDLDPLGFCGLLGCSVTHGGHHIGPSRAHGGTHGCEVSGFGKGLVALEVQNAMVRHGRSKVAEGLGATVRAGGVIAREDGAAAGNGDCVDDVGMVGGDDGTIEVGMPLGGPPSVHDHGFPTDVGEGLTGQTARSHAGGDDGGDPHGVKV